MSEQSKFDFRIRSAAEFVELVGGETDCATMTLFDGRESWLEGRKGHIGASSAWKIYDPEGRKRLFQELRGEAETEDLSGVEMVQRGAADQGVVRGRESRLGLL